MAGYIGKSQGVTQVDGYTRSEADAEHTGTQTFNRTSTDGDIVTLQKDGTTVGNIGTFVGFPYITSSTLGVITTGSQHSPCNSTGGSSGADNQIDLGDGTRRWKDLYLSGGVYLGGTTGDNHLDDYEEGTFTVSSTRAGVGEDSGGWIAKYVKIGRLVHVTISTSDWVRHLGSGYGAGQTFQINTNLPFVPSGQGGGRAAHTRTLANRELISLAWRNGSSTIYLTECGSNNSYNATNNVTTSNTQTNITLTFSGSYYTSQ